MNKYELKYCLEDESTKVKDLIDINGDLYGSIKPKEITNLIKERTNAEVSPSQLILKDNLNKIGSFKVNINFHSEVKANITIKIDKIQSK